MIRIPLKMAAASLQLHYNLQVGLTRGDMTAACKLARTHAWRLIQMFIMYLQRNNIAVV